MTDDANWQSVATEHEELAELMTAWPLLSPDLRVAILAIVRSADVAEEAVARTPSRIPGGSAGASPSQRLSHCPGKRAAAVA